MPRYEDSPEEAEAAIQAAGDEASRLDYISALAQENLDSAEDVLMYARESGNAKEIADAEWERDQRANDFQGIKDDYELAVKYVFLVQEHWGMA